MPNELESSLRAIAQKVASYVDDAAILTVETKYFKIGAGAGAGNDEEHRLARTVLKLDGDSEVVVPMREAEGGRLEIDADILEIHRANVASAIEYRSRIINALLGVLPIRGRGGP